MHHPAYPSDLSHLFRLLMIEQAKPSVSKPEINMNIVGSFRTSKVDDDAAFPQAAGFDKSKGGDLEKGDIVLSSLPTAVSGSHPRGNTKDFGFLPIPKRLQHDAEHPFGYTMTLNVLFAIAITLVVGNLHYSPPLLNELAEEFKVSKGVISSIPTLTQVGFALGIMFISPLGDLVRRRQLTLCVLALSTAILVIMALSPTVTLFQALSFFLGLVSVAPQVLIPLAADLAPPERRRRFIAPLFSALFTGIILARVLSGVLGSFLSFRAVYWMAAGLQFVVLIGGYLAIPDFPKKDTGLSYWGILKSMCRLAVTEPVLVQSCLLMMCASTQFAGFWVTLTFLLGGEPYNFSTLVIGLFGLVGLVGIAIGPILGRLVDKLAPWYAVLIATIGLMITQSIYTGAANLSVAAVVVACVGLGAFIDVQQVALSGKVFEIDEQGRARLNAVFIISMFIGQAIGSAGSSSIFLSYGPRGTGLLWLNLSAFQVVLLLVRGPHVPMKTWLGWKGGAKVLRSEESIDESNADSDSVGGEREEAKVTVVDLEKAGKEGKAEKSVLPDSKP